MSERRHDMAKIIRGHIFHASRPWPDGAQPSAPNWNPGCSCGESLYYFEHHDHLADALLSLVDTWLREQADYDEAWRA